MVIISRPKPLLLHSSMESSAREEEKQPQEPPPEAEVEAETEEVQANEKGKECDERGQMEGSPSSPRPPSLDEVEEILGYEFVDKKLLEEALTHSSIPDKSFSYERLEYVGDSVLNLIFAKELYLMYPELPPGALTRLRAVNVDTEKLARVAVKHGLHRYLRHKTPCLADQIRKFSEAILEYPLHSNGLVDVPKALADIVESTVGAVFIDSNFSLDTVWKVFKGLLEPIINMETMQTHPMTELYEVCQKRNLKVKFVDLWKETTAFNVLVEDQLVGRGLYGLRKDIAQNRAAKDALNNIGKLLLSDHKE